MTIGDDAIDVNDIPWIKARMETLTFADMLKAHRLCQEWTQPVAAEKLGITKQLLSAYENGKKLPSPSKAYEMAEVLGFSSPLAVLAVMNDQLRLAALPLRVSLKVS
jgi:transcriptional regulator with XRE-family HTH domain